MVMDGPATGARETPDANELRKMDAYWRAANHLSVGQIYPNDSPLLRESLSLARVKPLVVGALGQNFIYIDKLGEGLPEIRN